MKIIRFDWAIKTILRDKKNFDILEGFLSTLLNKDVKVLELLESESNNLEDLKFNRVDLMVKSEDEQFIIEIQNTREVDYLERILFGTSKVIVENLKLGEDYKNITKVISVNILYFNLGDGEDYIYHGKTDFYGLNKKDKLVLRKKVLVNNEKFKLIDKNIFPEYYLIRTEHFEEVIGSPIDEWIYMFKTGEIKENFKSKGMKAVKKKLNYLKMSEKERKSYDRYLMNLARENNIIESAEQDGYIKGLKEAKEEIEKVKKEKEKIQKEKEKVQKEKEEAKQREEKAQKEKEEAKQREEKAQKEKEEAKKQVINLVKLLLNTNTPIEKIIEITKLSVEEIKIIEKS